MKCRELTRSAILIATGLLFCAGPASASASAIDNARESTKLATELMTDSNAARQALVGNDTNTADKDIDEASGVRDELAKLARTNGTSMIVPIYADLDDTTTLSNAVKNHPGSPSPRASAALLVRSNTADITYLAIDLQKTQGRLDAAKKALRDRNDQAARDSLAAIGSDLIVRSNSVDLPLLTAREDLALAQRALKANQTAAAASDLKQASVSLKKYTKSGHSAEALQLSSDINSSASADSSQGPSLSTKIDDWWTKVAGWFSQHA